MAYTIGRLQQAKRLFLSDRQNVDSGNLAEHLDDLNSRKYSLRRRAPGTDTKLSSAWIDQDDTSDYDPSERTFVKRKRPSRLDGSDPGQNRPVKKSPKTPRLMVKMSVKSDTGKAFLGGFPAGTEQIEEMSEGEDVWDSNSWEMPDIMEGELGTKYALRKRDRRGDAGSPTTQSLLSLDLGHPAARGCKACWEFSYDCSLLERPLVYPCQDCREDRIDCELIIPPTWKRPCENCKRAKKLCSYNHGDTDHSLPCKRCQTLGINCIAGPAKYMPQTGDGDDDKDTETQDEKNPQGIPLTKLAGKNETIHPLSIPGRASGRVPASAAEKEEKQSNAVTRTIQTCFAHPVDLAYEPPSDGSDPCHWCSNFIYGLMGLGPRRVEVIDYGDGRYIEIEGGHVGDGHAPSRMCISCAHARLSIMRCPGHRVVGLSGLNINDFDFDAAYATLVPAVGQGQPAVVNPWCSLCPNPAFFGCGTGEGCGLVLCERCAMLMKGYKGDLDKVVARNKRDDAEFGSRADVDYLVAGSVLEMMYSS